MLYLPIQTKLILTQFMFNNNFLNIKNVETKIQKFNKLHNALWVIPRIQIQGYWQPKCTSTTV